MPARRKRRRRREHRLHHETQPTGCSAPAGDVREVDDAWLPPSSAQGVPREDLHDVDEAPPTVPSSSRGLRHAGEVERLAYSRRQAAEALGVSISTIDRHVVPSLDTVKTPWGQRLIPVAELERFMRSHLAPGRRRPTRRPAGRPPTLPRSVDERIRLEYARGRSLAEIARALTAEGVPTAHVGAQWWPSTVRAVLVRSSPPETARLASDSSSVTSPRAES